MDKNGKIEDVPENLDVLIKDKLRNVISQFGDLCDTLEKLGITFENDFKSFNSNNFLKGEETSDNKTKVMDKAPDLLHVSEMTCGSIIHSKAYGINAIGTEVVRSCSEETETKSSIMGCYDNDFDASSIHTDINDFSDCSSEASSTAVNLSNSDSDEFSSSEDISKSDLEVSSTTMTLSKKYRIRLRSVQNYSDSESVNYFSETSTNTVKYESHDTDVSATSVTADLAIEDLLLDLLSSENSQKSYGDFFSYCSQNMCKASKSPNRDSKSCTSNLRFSDRHGDTLIDELCNNTYKSLGVYLETTIVEKKSSPSELCLDNDKAHSVNADEIWENETSSNNKDLDLNNMICAGIKATIGDEDFYNDNNMRQCQNLKSFGSDSESFYSALNFSDSDAESSSSGLTFSDIKQENVLHTMELRNVMKNNDDTQDFNQEEAVIAEDSLHNDSGLGNHRGSSRNFDETKVRKELPDTFTVSDEDWNCLPLSVKFDKDPKRTLDEFLSNSNTIGSSGSGSDLCHSDWKLSEIDQESHTYEKSCKVFKMLTAIRNLIIKHNLPPSEFHSVLSSTKGYQESAIVSEESSENNPPSDNGRRSPVSFHESSDSQPDRLENIFKTIVKCHPIKNFAIPPYATANPEITLGIGDSWTKYTVNEKLNIPEECFNDIDSHSIMHFEYTDCFSQNSSIICDALIMDYLNTAVNLNIFFITKAKDVSIEGYYLRISTLSYLDDELGYLSAKLIIARNDWMKQFCEIDYNLRENAQWRISSRGFYYMGMVRICMALTEILLKYCLEKQLELEEYERDLIFYHECRN